MNFPVIKITVEFFYSNNLQLGAPAFQQKMQKFLMQFLNKGMHAE